VQAAKTKVEDGMAYTIKEGDYRQYGASAAGGGVVFTFEAEKEEDCKKRTCNNPGTATEISKKGWKRKRIS